MWFFLQAFNQKLFEFTEKIAKLKEIFFKINATIRNFSNVDILLGIDWFMEAEAEINPKNGTLKFPSTTVLLTDHDSDKQDQFNEICLMTEIADDEITEEAWESNGKPNDITIKTDLEGEQKMKLESLIAKYEDNFAQSYKDLCRCSVGEFSIETSTEKPI